MELKQLCELQGVSGREELVRAAVSNESVCRPDTLLALVRPAGPACHTGARSCFFRPIGADG